MSKRFTAGLPLAVRGPMGTVTHYIRDAFGRPTRISGPDGGTTQLDRTVEGKLARRTDPDGSTQSWTYDGEGNCPLHQDAVGGETRFEYTHFDLIAARTTPDGVRHEFAHDTELRVARVANPQGASWRHTYDQAGRLTAETDFDGRTLAYTHDGLGRLASRTNGLGQTIRYERDTAGRVVTKDVEGALTHFTYDAFGRLSGATGPDAELSYVRDEAGRIVRETCNGRVMTHGYDEAGRRIHRTTPTGAVSTWTYPADRRALLDASGHRVVFEFDEAGRETTRRIDDTLTIDHAYDALGRLTGQLVRGPGDATVQHRAYTYRPGGHLTTVDDHLRGRRHLELTREGRVTAVSADNWSERYAYDEAGNQTEASWPRDGGAAGPREYTGTRITRAGGIRYEHGAQGRVTLRQKRRLSHKPDTLRYAWDAEDRLTFVTTPDGTRWRYLYDPLGRRVAKQRLSVDGTGVTEQTDFTWDGDTLCEQSTHTADSSGSTVLTWDHDGLTPVAQTERKLDFSQQEIDRRFFAIVTDLVGTPRELIDEQGEVAWHTRATLWGTTTWNRTATGYTPSASRASTSTPNRASTTTTTATTTPTPPATSPPTPWASPRPPTPSPTSTTPCSGQTPWAWQAAPTDRAANTATAWCWASTIPADIRRSRQTPAGERGPGSTHLQRRRLLGRRCGRPGVDDQRPGSAGRPQQHHAVRDTGRNAQPEG